MPSSSEKTKPNMIPCSYDSKWASVQPIPKAKCGDEQQRHPPTEQAWSKDQEETRFCFSSRWWKHLTCFSYSIPQIIIVFKWHEPEINTCLLKLLMMYVCVNAKQRKWHNSDFYKQFADRVQTLCSHFPFSWKHQMNIWSLEPERVNASVYLGNYTLLM